MACWSFHWVAGNAGETQTCAYARARASVTGRKMVRVHSHPHWRWDRRCPLSDHWLIVTNNSRPYSIRNPETCTNLWRFRRLVWLLDAAPTSVCFCDSSPPWKTFQRGNLENSVSAAPDKDPISHWICLSEQLLKIKNIFSIMLLVSNTNLIWWMREQEMSTLLRWLLDAHF